MKALFLFLCFVISIASTAQHGKVKHPKKHKLNTKAILRGSGKSQKVQNKEANKENLSRIKNDAQLKRMKKHGYLVPITHTVKVDKRLNAKFRYVRPWTNKFLRDMAVAFKKKFHHDMLKVNSAVRTVAYQKQLRKHNGNAAKAGGNKASSHPTGATVDIAKKNLNAIEVAWVRNYLAGFEAKKLIEVTEEKNQSVFHFMVFNKYQSK